MLERNYIVPENGWRTAELFHELQDLSGAAVEGSDASSAALCELGLMWIVVRYELTFTRPFQAGEFLTFRTWANPFRHRMSQRNYFAFDTSGNTVMRGAGIWSVADRIRRNMVEPEDYSICFDTESTGEEAARPATPQKIPLTESVMYTVPAEVLDSNGHMNNTRYFSLAEDCIGGISQKFSLAEAKVAYQNEARLGDKLNVQWGRDGNRFYCLGTGSRGICFQMGLKYIPRDS
ncbi:MAG: hypothetical protein K6C08_00960 [Oscillospiraceae bacterium]|nr:hypothetical protein [Oscillospiraceae bacterium]